MNLLRLTGSYLALLVGVASLTPYPTFGQQSEKHKLAPSLKQASFSSDFIPNFATRPIANNGYLLYYRRHAKPGITDNIFLVSLTNHARATLPFDVGGSSIIRMEAGTVTPQKTVIIGGSYIESRKKADVERFSSNPRGSNPSNFISEVSMDGTKLSLFQTGDFTPERVCVTSDGSIWALGQEWPEENRIMQRSHSVRDYPLLREYKSDGKAIGVYLSRSLVAKRAISRNYRDKELNSSPAFLSCDGTSVQVYIAQAPIGYLWYSVDSKTKAVEMKKVPTPPRTYITGFVQFSGNTYGSFRVPQSLMGQHSPIVLKDDSGGQKELDANGIYELKAIPDSRLRWVRVLSPNEETEGTILGNDGPYLVHAKGRQPLAANPILYWSAAQ